jgi:hypothetical protein
MSGSSTSLPPSLHLRYRADGSGIVYDSAGRLTAVQYGDTPYTYNDYCNGETPTSDGYVEEYSYHAAGGVTAKRLTLIRTTYDDDYGARSATAPLEADYTYDAPAESNHCRESLKDCCVCALATTGFCSTKPPILSPCIV